MRYGRTACAAMTTAALAIGAQGAAAAPTSITALTDRGQLLSVSAAKPNKVLGSVTISGLMPGETLVGIDRRPNGGALYGVVTAPMAQAKVVTIAQDGTITSATPLVVLLPGPPPVLTTNPIFLSGSSFGVDFNPTVDRLRLVSDTGQNLRINVMTGGTLVDRTLNPGSPAVVGAAYTNNDNDAIAPVTGGTGTQLFDIDTSSDSLARQDPPNAGTLVTIGLLGFAIGGSVGFDVYSDVAVSMVDATRLSAVTNTAYATFAESNGTDKLYTVDLASGAATLVGPFARADIADIAVPIDVTP